MSQRWTGPSVEAAARVRPSGLKATARTRPVTVKVATVRRSATRRSSTRPSEPPVASSPFPGPPVPGPKATALTGPLCPPSRARKGCAWVLRRAPRAWGVLRTVGLLGEQHRGLGLTGGQRGRLDGQRLRTRDAFLTEGALPLLVGEGAGGQGQHQQRDERGQHPLPYPDLAPGLRLPQLLCGPAGPEEGGLRGPSRLRPSSSSAQERAVSRRVPR